MESFDEEASQSGPAMMAPLKAPPGRHSSILASIASLTASGCFKDVRLTCSDGSMLAPGIVLAAVSPMFSKLGHKFTEDMFVLLPDFNIRDMSDFVQHLLSPTGPKEGDETLRFGVLMDFFGREPPEDDTSEDGYNSSDQNDHSEYSDYHMSGLASAQCEPVVKAEPADYDSDPQDALDDNKIFDGAMQQDSDDTDQKPDLSDLKVERGMEKKTSMAKYNQQLKDIYDSWLKTYTCPQCDTSMKSAVGMANHLRWHNENPLVIYKARHSCQECGKVFKKSGELKNHINRKHRVMPRSFKCSWPGCSKAFKTKGEQKTHQGTHTNEKNFICEDCGFSTRTKQQLESHVLRKHSDLKPTIPCEECGKLYRTRADVNSHQITHRAQKMRIHRCDECNLTFRKESSLKRHMVFHNPDRPLQCPYCPLRYKTKDQLRAHTANHEPRRYSCMYCELVFAQHSNLKRHVRSKHPKEKVQFPDYRTKVSRPDRPPVRHDMDSNSPTPPPPPHHHHLPPPLPSSSSSSLPPPQAFRHQLEAYSSMFPFPLPTPSNQSQ